MICPATRAGALDHLAAFLPAAPLYARDRNRVEPGHPAVSRLSPAIRHRLITEDEAAIAVLQAHRFSRVEKLVQEIYWRRYWKSWLSLRPQVWADYCRDLDEIPAAQISHVARIEAFQSGNPVIDHFTRELLGTGYLHNHARMWFAAWWIHVAGLSWQSGAAFLFRHLLDGDPASNTLSWRWVAGLQPPGKAYLARRSNLEKYLAPSLVEALAGDWSDFDQPTQKIPSTLTTHAITRPHLDSRPLTPVRTTGIWIHEEDLSPETSPLAEIKPAAILVTAHREAWDQLRFPELKRHWLQTALDDSATRASAHWQVPAAVESAADLSQVLILWATHHQLQQIACLRPDPGPLSDALPGIIAALEAQDINFAFIDRPRDLALRPLATSGFFKFWESLQKRELLPGAIPAQLDLFG